MDFKDLLEKNKRPQKSKYKLDEIQGDILTKHGSEVADQIEAALLDPANTDELLAKTITDFGYPVGASSMRRYRVSVLGVARG